MLIPYNLYNLEPDFRKYLLAVNIQSVSLKNYLSDFRHFAGWLHSRSQLNQSRPDSVGTKSVESVNTQNTDSTCQRLQVILTTETIICYKQYLTDSNLPIKTINRRLSTLRKFCSFCISQGWTKENVAKKVGNVLSNQKSVISSQNNSTTDNLNNNLDQFRQDLITQGLDNQTITNYVDNVHELLSI